ELERILRRAIELLARPREIALHEAVRARVLPRVAHPARPVAPVRLVLRLGPHEVLLDVDLLGEEVPDVAPGPVAHRADRIRRTFGHVVVDAIDETAMRVRPPLEHAEEARAIERVLRWVATACLDDRRQDVGILNERASARARLDPRWPPRDERRMEAAVPVRPFASRELRPLLGAEKDERRLRLLRLV